MSGLRTFGSAISPQRKPCGPLGLRGKFPPGRMRSEIDDGDGAYRAVQNRGYPACVWRTCLGSDAECGSIRPADVAEPVDAVDLGSIARKGVEVRVLSSAPGLTVAGLGPVA